MLAIDIDNPEPEIPKLAGDVNLDERVNVADVMLLVRYVLKEDIDVFSYRNADFNEDGTVDLSDAIAIIDEILGEGEGGDDEEEGGDEVSGSEEGDS